MQDYIKRLLDIGVAAIALLVLSPILVATWCLIRLEDGGPSTYVSKRVGSGFKVFKLYKFRSMYRNADARLSEMTSLNQYAEGSDKDLTTECEKCQELGYPCSPLLFQDAGSICESRWANSLNVSNAAVFFKMIKDPRVTKVGRFIRKTSIDELPQFINVLKGDMSIVGNRPLPIYEALSLTTDQSISRFMAPAGLTGLWQVTNRGKSGITAEERIALDNEYYKTRSLTGDLLIMLQTIPALLQTEDV